MECWAACLGDCDNVGSRSTLSRSAFIQTSPSKFEAFPGAEKIRKTCGSRRLLSKSYAKGTMSSWALRWIGLRNIPVTNWVQHSVCSLPGKRCEVVSGL